jgi:chromosome segregation ATPase
MTRDEHFDVRRVIEENTRVKTLKELEQEGKRAVKVVRASQIYDLIAEAVDRTIQSTSLDMAEKQKLEVIKQSNEEFRRLVREREEERQRNEKREAQLGQYEDEIRKLRAEFERLSREQTDDRRKLATQKQTLEDTHEVEEKLKRELRAVIEERDRIARERDTVQDEIGKMRTDLGRRDTDRDQSLRQTREENDRTVTKLRAETTRADEAERKVQQLLIEIERLKAEIDNSTRNREEDRKLIQSLRDSDDAWQKKVDGLQAELRQLLSRRDDELSRAEEAEKLSAQSADELRALRGDLQRLVRDQENAEAQKRAQTEIIAAYEKQIVALTEEMRSAHEKTTPPELINALFAQVQSIKSSFDQLNQGSVVTPAQQARMDREAQAFSTMEKLFAEKMEKMSKQISNKLEDITYKPKEKAVESAKIVLDNLFRDEAPMETNLENVGIRTQSGGGILGALERLKSLQGGGLGKGAAPAGEGEETKDGTTER